MVKALMKQRFAFLILFILGLVSYGFGLNNQFVWDDEQFIYKNQFVKTFAVKEIFTTNTIAGAGELSNYYRPLTTLSFAIDYSIWGLTPFGFHLTNLLLHISAGCVLILILRALKIPIIPATIIAGLFIVHPIQTEAVSYANSRGDSLFTFFAFGSVLSFLYVLSKKNYAITIYNLSLSLTPKIFGTLAVMLYATSIFSKEIGIATGGLHAVVFLHHFFSKKKSIKK
jgi:protein O-mannosyl-transferase